MERHRAPLRPGRAVERDEQVQVWWGDPDVNHGTATLESGVWQAMASGFVYQSGDPNLDTLLSRGGMDSMLNTIWLIMAALAYGRLLQFIEPADDHPRGVVGRPDHGLRSGAGCAARLLACDRMTGPQAHALPTAPSRRYPPIANCRRS